MQAKLPDINAAIVRYRNNLLHAFDNNEANTVIVSWSAINALLPDDYKVEVNTEKFLKLVAENKIIICSKCEEKIPYQDVKFNDLLLSSVESLITQKKHKHVWNCPKCSFENIFNFKKIKIVKFQQPYYLEVVPEPPTRHLGIVDRSSFDTQFRRWFTLALDEIESKIGKYRADYIAQMEADDMKFVEDEDHSN